jgi:hypothetical protein
MSSWLLGQNIKIFARDGTVVRTTVPRSIIKQFGLTENDKLEWMLKAEGGALIIQGKPQKGEIR